MGVDLWIEFILNWAAVPVGLFAFIHAGLAARRRLHRGEQAHQTVLDGADRWRAPLACALFNFYDFTLMFWIAGLVTILVYIVDVKPKVAEVQRGSQW